ncbi:hypothetical protein K438DRAFT_1753797 [Mycena galopus ATCC 62051]|nr:hypothetical protein K438DRAFT_1753797 [Mycena galopus ATCC 62051]
MDASNLSTCREPPGKHGDGGPVAWMVGAVKRRRRGDALTIPGDRGKCVDGSNGAPSNILPALNISKAIDEDGRNLEPCRGLGTAVVTFTTNLTSFIVAQVIWYSFNGFKVFGLHRTITQCAVILLGLPTAPTFHQESLVTILANSCPPADVGEFELRDQGAYMLHEPVVEHHKYDDSSATLCDMIGFGVHGPV